MSSVSGGSDDIPDLPDEDMELDNMTMSDSAEEKQIPPSPATKSLKTDPSPNPLQFPSPNVLQILPLNPIKDLPPNPPPGSSSNVRLIPPPDPLPVKSDKRVRFYPNSAGSPFVMYVRQTNKPINTLLISSELHKTFKTVKKIEKVNASKVKIIFGDRTEVNLAVKNELLNRLYRPYIPSSEVEIDGVVEEADIDLSYVRTNGFGTFKDSRLRPVQVIDCQRLAMENKIKSSTQKFVPSNHIRVTFSGKVLPSYLEIDHVLLPVRYYTPKPMLCSKCQRYGHTEKLCVNKGRCSKCGESHDEVLCEVPTNTCNACKIVHVNVKECPVYKEKQQKIRSKIVGRSKFLYSQIVQSFEPSVSNYYESLSVNESESDEEPQAHCSYTGTPQKRSKPSSVSQIKKIKRDKKETPNIPKQPIPSNKPLDINNPKKFPPLPKPIKDSPNANESFQEKLGFTIPELIKLVAETLQLSPTWVKIIHGLTPLITKIWQKIVTNVPLLSLLFNED